MRNIYKYSFILGLVILFTSIFFLSFKLEDKPSTSKNPDEYIASYIEGEYQTAIPGKDDGYVVDKIVCDNGATGTWNNEEWGINIRNASKKVKCSIYFVKGTIFQMLGKTIASTEVATDDPDNNIRYIGKDPGNYVYFNCSDYSNQTADTCEKWRIIGVFNNITKEDGTKENLVKIIRNESIGSFLFDGKSDGHGTGTNIYGSNDWTDSHLMMMLNPNDYLKSGYTIENNIVKDSNNKPIYQNMGSYYNGSIGCIPKERPTGGSSSGSSGSKPSGSTNENSTTNSYNCTSIDFTSTGLKNDTTRNAIESVMWNIGAITTSLTANETYSAERGTSVASGHSTTWTGKIALMYPSDYVYTNIGGTTYNRDSCLGLMATEWNNDECSNNNYLNGSSTKLWILSQPLSGSSYYFINNGRLSISIPNNYDVKPTLYLKSNISITSGDGSSASPYQLSLN